MADKPKTPKFRSDAERKKWDALQHNAGHSISKIAEGKGQPQDFQKIEKTLEGLSKLAKRVFSDAVKAAEAQVNIVQKANLKKTKEDQAEFSKAVGEVLKEQMPEILAKIKDIIEIESLDQDTRFEKTLSSQLNSFASFLPPKDIPTTDDVMAIHEASLEQQGTTDDRKWDSRQRKLVDSITDSVAAVIKATILSAAMASVSPAAAARYSTPLLGAPQASSSRAASQDWDLDDEPTVGRRGSSMLSGAHTRDTASSPWELTDDEPRAQTKYNTGLTTVHDVGNALVKSGAPGGGQSTALTSIAQSLGTLALAGPATAATAATTGAPAAAGAAAEDDEKTADVWWRSFGTWIGDKYESVASKADTAKGWLAALGTGLMSILLAPQLYETIAKKAKELLTWDNIKKSAEGAWNLMYDKGSELIKWVTDKLGLGPAIDKAKDVFKDISDAVGWVASKLGFSSKKEPTKFNSRQATGGKGTTAGGGGGGRQAVQPLTQAQQASVNKSNAATLAKGESSVASGAKLVGSAIGKGVSAVGRGAATVGKALVGSNVPESSIGGGDIGALGTALAPGLKSAGSSVASGASALVNAKSSTGFVSRQGGARPPVVSQPVPTLPTSSAPATSFGTSGITKTTSVPGTAVRTTPAVTHPVAGAGTTSTVGGASGAPKTNSTSTVGLDSFKISSGVDDSLALMNMSVITG
jgi:hypothetical protein